MTRSKSDGGLVPLILRYAELRRLWAWRMNSGAIRNERGVPVAMAPAGTPDVLLVLPGGYLAGIEAKARNGRQRASQKAWQATAEAHGVRYALVRSIGEVRATIDGWLKEVSSA